MPEIPKEINDSFVRELTEIVNLEIQRAESESLGYISCVLGVRLRRIANIALNDKYQKMLTSRGQKFGDLISGAIEGMMAEKDYHPSYQTSDGLVYVKRV